MYLTDADFLTSLNPTQLKALSSPIVIESMTYSSPIAANEERNVATIKSYLGNRFDVDAALADREPLLIGLLLDLTLYDAFTFCSPNDIPDLRVKRRDDAISQLRQLAKGDLVALHTVVPGSPNRINLITNSDQIQRPNMNLI